MAPGKVANDFDAIIKADRQRRQNEALANEMLGSGRKSSALRADASRAGNTGRKAPLATRVTRVKKPSARTMRPVKGNVHAEWTHDLHGTNSPFTRKMPRTRTEQLYAAFDNVSTNTLDGQTKIVKSEPARSFSIRGLAGPYTVIAKNFARGTTAADIESAMVQVGGVCLECRLLSERPSVIAEVVFETKDGAEAVVTTFNNQEADGHILHVYHKISPSPVASATASSAGVTSIARSSIPLGPRKGRYDNPGRYGNRSDTGKVIDGTYGFEDRMNIDDGSTSRKLYSDDLVRSNSISGRGSSWR